MEWHELNEGRGDPRNHQPRQMTRTECIALVATYIVCILVVVTILATGQ